MEEPASTVECPVCGESFDPTAAGGWCTNPECGEYQHDEAAAATRQDAAPDGDPPEQATADRDRSDAQEDDGSAATAEPETGDTPGVESVDPDPATGSDDADPGPAAPETDSEPAASAGTVGDGDADTTTDDAAADRERGADAADPGGADSTAARERDGTGTEGAAEPAAAGTGDAAAGAAGESASAPDEGDAGTATAGTGEDAAPATPEVVCPECSATVEADAAFCPSCGTDVSALPDEEDEGGEETPACPDCGADVAPGDNFCTACGTDLTDPEPLTECPACGAEVGEDDAYCAGCGEHLDPHRPGSDADDPAAGDGTESPADPAPASADSADDRGEQGSDGTDRAAPEALVLGARGRRITVEDGDAVGRQIRRLLIEADGDENDAVRIHREHVRFVREDGGFSLVDLGENPTALNGEHLEKGDRRPVGPGDELELSGVVTLDVDRP